MQVNVSFTQLIAWLIFLLISLYIFGVMELSYLGKVSLMCFILALGLFVLSKVPAGLVGMLCLVIAILLGIPETMLFQAFEQPIVWLMIGAFIISAVIEKSGLLERLVAWMARHCQTKLRAVLFIIVTVLCMTFTIPSTSSRAAAFMPIFQALQVQFPKYKTFFGMLIPIMILMLTNATLIGAGSHLIGVSILEGQTEQRISYLSFLIWGLPFALLISVITVMVLWWHIQPQSISPIQSSTKTVHTEKRPLTSKEKTAAVLIGITMLLWLTESIHGFDIAFVTIAMSFIMLLPQLNLIGWTEALKKVSWSLIFFVASATVLGELLVKYQVVDYFQNQMMHAIKALPIAHEWFLVLLLSTVSVLSHLVITSHTTRAVVLIPAFILLAQLLSLNPVAIVFIGLIGMNYCVTFPVSSKALLIFYELEPRPYTTKQLAQVSLYLMPLYIGLMIIMYFVYWQFMGLHLK